MEAMFLPGVENNPKPGPYYDSLRRMRGTGLEYLQIWHLFAFFHRVRAKAVCRSAPLPAVLDHMDNRAERGYAGWPDRMYLIDTKGRVRFKSEPRRCGFSTRDPEQALQQVTRVVAHP